MRHALMFSALLCMFGCGSSAASDEQKAAGGGAGAPSGGSGGASSGGTGAVSSGTGGVSTGGAASGGAAGSGGTEVEYPIPDWSEALPEDEGLDAAALSQAAQVADDIGSYCLLVIRHGKLVGESYFGDAEKTSTHPSWSVAKSYSSALVGIAIERGDIQSLDQSVSDFIPEWKADERAKITVGNIVSMTSGLEWTAFQDYVSMGVFSQDVTKFAIALGAEKEPGSNWTYHNGGVQILEPLFRAATGQTMEQYAEAHLWSKLGMTASWGHDAAGHPTAYANVLATCRDHARLGYLYLHGGRWGSEQVVPKAWVTATTTPSQLMNRAYGYLWWLNGETPAMDAMMQAWPGRMSPAAPKDMFAARGFGNQFIDVIPSLDMIVVRFGPDPAGALDLVAIAQDQRFEKHDQILSAVLDAVVD